MTLPVWVWQYMGVGSCVLYVCVCVSPPTHPGNKVRVSDDGSDKEPVVGDWLTCRDLC